MTENKMQENRPSRDTKFAARVVSALQAAAVGDAATMSEILTNDASVANATGPHPIWGGAPQPLHVAAERNHLELVRQLLDQGADVNGQDADYDGWSPLMLAAHGGRLGIHQQREKIVALLVARGAEVDIFSASLIDDVKVIEKLIAENPASAKITGPAGATALHFVRSADTAQTLLDASADPNARCGWGTSPLERASFRGREGRAVADVLIDAGAETHACAFACLGDLERLKPLLEKDPASLKSCRKIGASIEGTPLHGAVSHGHLQLAQYLLDHGADVNERANHGQTPLHLATSRLDLVQLLVDRGGDISACDDEHGTPPIEWARFLKENLEPDSQELPRVIEFLEKLP